MRLVSMSIYSNRREKREIIQELSGKEEVILKEPGRNLRRLSKSGGELSTVSHNNS